MISYETEDVIQILKLIAPYLIGLGVVLILLIAFIISARFIFKDRSLRRMVRGQGGLAMVLAALIVVNLIIFGPIENLLDLTNVTSDGITDETKQKAEDTAEQIADEGFVLLENKDEYLPLTQESEKKIALFGYRSAHPIYGGTGSGGINDNYTKVSLKEGLESSGFSINEELYSVFENYSKSPTVTIENQAWDLPEPAISNYSSLIDGVKNDGYETAVVVIGRLAGEGHNDMPLNPKTCSTFNNNFNSDTYEEFEDGQHYLELDHTEKDMIELVCNNFDNVVVVYNGANPFEFGFIEDYTQIKSLIWAPGPGNVGFKALGKILSGETNPSGRTTDSFYYDLKQNPSYNNYELTNYSNLADMAVDGMNAGKPQKYYPSFVNYTEGIYVGYKYYETASSEGVIDFDTTIQYPFGYGLSYTSFTQEMKNFKVNGGNIEFDVTVKNTGSTSGKDVVEVYFNPPYTNGGIEKSSKNLLEVGKTKELNAGEEETIHFSLSIEDMASYDEYVNKAYVLEKGEYVISIQKNSHDVIDSKTYEQEETIVYDSTNARESDDVAATNKFDSAKGDNTYLSRKDKFANLAEASKGPSSTVMSDEYVAGYHLNSNYDPTTYINEDDVMPTTGKDNGILLKELRGKSYDDEMWDDFLDQLTIDELDELVSMGGYQTIAIDSVGKVKTGDFDGPAAINNNFTGQGSIGFPIEVVIACTFNTNLTQEYGKLMGQMNKELGGHGWYAPGMNMHRSPFTGRNYEYYSEDSRLSGLLSSAAVKGAKEVGVYSYIKHFAMYDFNGKMTCVWSNEQAIREIYLKPFEISVKDGGANAVMVSWSFIGNKWVGEKSELLNDVLRDEWGFEGMVITDFFRNNGHGFMNADVALANGVDLMLSTYSGPQNHVTYKDKASNVIYMRRAAKNILYTVVNSWAYESDDIVKVKSTWRTIATTVDIIVPLLIVAGSGTMVWFYIKKRKESKQAD